MFYKHRSLLSTALFNVACTANLRMKIPKIPPHSLFTKKFKSFKERRSQDFWAILVLNPENLSTMLVEMPLD